MERTVPAFTNYGCNRIALVQAEYRGYFGVTGDEDRERDGNEDDRGSGSERSAWKSRRGSARDGLPSSTREGGGPMG